ncbi:MAG: hypothetical protein O3C68_08565, partial [Proteobacteria bacterium]|nr:hypothetical protein [Pseudomonadota bacterium]
MKIVSWNIAGRDVCWQRLLESDYDIALLQEARRAPDEVASSGIRISPGEWVTEGKVNRPWRAAIAILNPTIEVEWIEAKSIAEGDVGEFVVSRSGTVTAANITTKAGSVLTVVSAYTPWEKPLKELASPDYSRVRRSKEGGRIFGD